MSDKLLNKGVYTLPEAARLVSLGTSTNITADKISRWLWGRERSRPLWSPEIESPDETKLVSFRDVVELMFVSAFRAQGVSLQTIRKVIDQATELITDPYPLSSPEFRTDGKTIIAGALKPTEERLVFDLVSGQLLLDYVFGRLRQGIDYSEMSQAARLWPLGRDRQVVVDPSLRFGEPIIARHGIPTAVLHSAYEAEGSYKAAAHWYGVPQSAVKDAVDFERRLKAA